MAVSLGGGRPGEELPLTLQNFSQWQAGAGVVMGTNGFSRTSQSALQIVQSGGSFRAFVQSGPGARWGFGGAVTRGYGLQLWLSRAPPLLRLSAVAVETAWTRVLDGAGGGPQRPLRDWTAPPSLGNDHSYTRIAGPRPAWSSRRQQRQRANHSPRSLPPPRIPPPRRRAPPPPGSANRIPPLAARQPAAGPGFLSTDGERARRVSQIRIRRAPPRDALLTPMGLPRAQRLKKKEFSLEEIYTNKDYRPPPASRSLETIFEEPREKDGALLLTGHQRRRRLLMFPDRSQPPRRRRPGLPGTSAPPKRAAARRHGEGPEDHSDLDLMLLERLSQLEEFMTQQGLEG